MYYQTHYASIRFWLKIFTFSKKLSLLISLFPATAFATGPSFWISVKNSCTSGVFEHHLPKQINTCHISALTLAIDWYSLEGPQKTKSLRIYSRLPDRSLISRRIFWELKPNCSEAWTQYRWGTNCLVRWSRRDQKELGSRMMGLEEAFWMGFDFCKGDWEKQMMILQLHLILSSNLASARTIKPLNNSRASTRPLLLVSQISNDDWFAPNICSNSVWPIEKLSHMLLNEPWNSRSLERETRQSEMRRKRRFYYLKADNFFFGWH